MRVSVIGTGYVGLVSSICLAERGHQVTCVDIDLDKINKINRGISPIHEEGLEELLKRNIGSRLRASTDLRDAVINSQISIITVGTPFNGKEIDLTHVKGVARQIGTALRDKGSYHLVLIKSTVVPGTSDGIVLSILEESSGKKAGADFGVGMNPEFLREGDAVKDFMHPDRIVLGGIDEKSMVLQRELFDGFRGVDKLETNCKTAEMIKYTANSLLATLISFANEIGNLCAAVGGVDVVDVMRGVHMDKRLTPIMPSGERIIPSFTTYIEAGCGFGGSCFPKDLMALSAFGAELGQPMRLLESVLAVNAEQYRQIMSFLYKHFPKLQGLKVAVLGLAFKPGTDDMRESPAIPVVRELLNGHADIKVFDPVAMCEAKKIFGDTAIEYSESMEESIEGAEIIVIMTRWPEFNRLPSLIQGMPHQPVLIDGRRMLDKRSVQCYEGIGM